jgi:hypothetical protein
VGETSSHTLREELRLRVFVNRMLGRIFRPKEEITGRKKIHNGEVHNLYSSPNIIVLRSPD